MLAYFTLFNGNCIGKDRHEIKTTEALAKIVIPVKTGIQRFCNALKRPDSHFRGNDTLFFFKTFARASTVN